LRGSAHQSQFAPRAYARGYILPPAERGLVECNRPRLFLSRIYPYL
jgi:hypothetical protein